MFGDLALDHAASLAIDRDFLAFAAASALTSSLELDCADLFRERGRERIGVVLFADQYVPEELRHLAGAAGSVRSSVFGAW